MNLDKHRKYSPPQEGRGRVTTIYLGIDLGNRWRNFIRSEDLNASSVIRTLIEEFLNSSEKVNQLTKQEDSN